MYTIRTTSQTVTGITHLTRLITLIANQSQWFAVEPWPDEEYRVTVKEENAKRLAQWVKLTERSEVHATFQEGYIYEMMEPYDDGEPVDGWEVEAADFRFFEPCEYAYGQFSGDGWVKNSQGDTHPGVDRAPIPMRADEMTAHRVACPHCDHNDFEDTGDGDQMVCYACDQLFNRSDIAPYNLAKI